MIYKIKHIFMLFFLVHILFAPQNLSAKPGTIRIALFEHWEPYCYRNSEGQLQGYLIDYWRLVGQKVDQKVEFFPYSNSINVSFVLNSLKGQIDIFLGPELFLEQYQDYTKLLDNSISFRWPLYIHKDLIHNPYLHDLSGIPVGLIYSLPFNYIVDSIYPNAKKTLFTTKDQINKSLHLKKVLIYIPHWNPFISVKDEVVVPYDYELSFSPSIQIFPIIWSGNTKIKELFYGKREFISTYEDRYLKEKWEIDKDNEFREKDFFVTENEMKWVHMLNNMKIGIPENVFPEPAMLKRINKRNKARILTDFFAIFLSKTVLTDEYFDIEMIDSHDIDKAAAFDFDDANIVVGIENTKANRQKLLLTSPIVTSPLVIVSRQNNSILFGLEDLNMLNIEAAVVEGSYAYEILKTKYRNIDIHTSKSIDRALKAIKFKKADIVIGDLISVSAYLQKMDDSNLQITTITGERTEFCFGVRKDEPELFTIIERYLKMQTEQVKAGFFRNLIESSTRYIINWMYIGRILFIFFICFVSILTMILVWNRRLANEVEKRKKAQLDLAKTNTALEYSNKAKSQFLANMSHEIRTPMNAIIGLTHLCLKTELNNKQKEYIQKIDSSAHSLLGIINDILDFSKIEAGKMSLDKVHFLLDDVVDNIRSIIGENARQKGLELSVVIEDSVPKILLGDPLRLSQVLLNLGSNAVKFTNSGKVEFKASVKEVVEDLITICFSVYDTGIGLTAEQINGLFQPFVQADGSTTRRFGGTGLGLVICKELVEMMNGAIGVESEKDRGSCFSFTAQFTLPAEDDEKQYKLLNRNIGHVSENVQFVKANVLLAEDNEINRQIVVEVLKEVNIDVETAVNGREAINRLEEYPDRYKLVLMDIMMPVMDGYEAVRHIRNVLGLKELPIIAMTASAMAGDKDKALSVGMNSYVTKPIDPGELFEVLGRFLERLEPEQEENEKKNNQFVEFNYQLPGVNTAEGLLRMNNDSSLYLKVLKKFKDTYGTFHEDVKEMINNHSREDLVRMMHTLKSTAGNIGAYPLASAAGSAEKKLNNDDQFPADDHFDSLYAQLYTVLSGLKNLEQKTEQDAGQEVVDAATVLNYLQNLRPYLDLSKPKQSFEIIDKLQKLKVEEVYFYELSLIIENTRKYKFKEALSILDELVKKL